MKKTFPCAFILAFALLLGTTANAQFTKGDILINPGVSFLGYSYGYGYGGGYSGLPALSASVEYSITDEIGVGGYVGYQSRKYSFSDIRWTNIGFGARGVYHASSFLNDALNSDINAEKLDIYAGLSLGYQTYSFKSDNSIYNSSSGGVVFGGILGVRYMFKPSIGVYGELGRGAFGAITLGATFKL